MRRTALAAVAATTLCGAANATVTTYDVTGVFQSGQTLTGSFNYDDTFSDYKKYSAFNLTVSNYGSFTTFFAIITSGGTYTYSFQNGAPPNNLNLNFALPVSGVTAGSTLSTSTTLYGAQGTSALRTGVITVSVPASSNVPESASWAMMILGFGAIGAAMRRRKVTVKFA